MADPSDDAFTSGAPGNDDQIEELKHEIAKLKEALAERAQGFYDTAADQASRAGEALRTQAAVARDNPGTITTAVLLGGLVGLVVGLALGQSEPSRRRW